MPPPAAGSSDPGVSPRKRGRPRGLWKARAASRWPAQDRQESPSNSNFESDIDDRPVSSSSVASREQRSGLSAVLAAASGTNDDVNDDNDNDNDDDDIVHYFLDHPDSNQSSPYSKPDWTAHTKIINMSSTAKGTQIDAQGPIFDRDDWDDLKVLFYKATELYEADEQAEALPTLRGAMHECHRFLHCYEDPSTLFIESPAEGDRTPPTPERSYSRGTFPFPSGRKKWKGSELPTAAHSIMGTALYLMGNIIDNDPSLALEGEPDSPIAYWAYALDVFEAGETIPSRTGRDSYEAPEDWSMSMYWGRTFVSLADATAEWQAKAKRSGTEGTSLTPLAQFTKDEPKWPEESPFHIITFRRSTTTRRMSLDDASAHELMVLGMDQFSRAMFHMPHAKKHLLNIVNPSLSTGTYPTVVFGTPACHPLTFSRPRELFSAAYDILVLADKLENPTEKQQCAAWADSIFDQMKNEADVDAWRSSINSARGRCCLISGSAGAIKLEPALERGDLGVLDSEDAEDAREALEKAIGFFERAIRSATSDEMTEAETIEVEKMLVESLLTLANLTSDSSKQEQLYARAQAEGAEYDLEMDLDYDDEEDEDQVMED